MKSPSLLRVRLLVKNPRSLTELCDMFTDKLMSSCMESLEASGPDDVYEIEFSSVRGTWILWRVTDREP